MEQKSKAKTFELEQLPRSGAEGGAQGELPANTSKLRMRDLLGKNTMDHPPTAREVRQMSLVERGYPVQAICQVMGISRASHYRACRHKEDVPRSMSTVSERDEVLAETIRQIQSEWPGYGVRRIWAVLRFDYGLLINLKRVRRVMRAYGLLQKPVSYKVPRRKHTGRVAVSESGRLWGTDLIKTWSENFSTRLENLWPINCL